MSQPLISIALPVYNAGSYLRLAVLSIVNQTYTNWELFVVDDGSTDNALRSIQEINDSRITIVSDGQNKGIACRLNEAVEMANGYYFARMDADDISLPRRLESQISALKADSCLDLVACRAYIIDADGSVTGELPYHLTHQSICQSPWIGFYMAHPTWMGKLSWFKEHRYSNTAVYCEDQILLLRSYQDSKFATVNKILFKYRDAKNFDFDKRLRTNLSFVVHSVRFFLSEKRFHFILLVLTAFLLRVIKAIALLINGKLAQ